MISKILSPIKDLKHLIYLIIFLVETLDNIDLEILTNSLNEEFNQNYTQDEINLSIQKFCYIFRFDFISFRNHMNNLYKKVSKIPKVTLPPIKQCLVCKRSLVKTKSFITYCFLKNQTRKNLNFVFDCFHCDIEYSIDYFFDKVNKIKKLYPIQIKQGILSTSSKTSFDISFIKYFSLLMMKCGVSFESFSYIYNLATETFAPERELCRKRLSEAWFTYTLRSFLQNELNINQYFETATLDSFILKYYSLIKENLVINWYESHLKSCKNKNCLEIVVVDGNHKLRRARCIANNREENACDITPAIGSYFCKNHSNYKITDDCLSIDDSFEGIVQDKLDSYKKKWYLFKYSQAPKERWLDEDTANKYPSLINEYFKAKNSNNLTECNTNKDVPCLNKKKTTGLLIVMFSCGRILNFCEMIRSESLTIVCKLLQETTKITGINIKFCVYDNSCGLGKFIKNNLTDFEELKNIKCLVDRFHVLNHKCKKQNNCDNDQELSDINTQVCEQTNFLINKFKHISKHMNKEHYNLFYLNYFNTLNKRTTS